MKKALLFTIQVLLSLGLFAQAVPNPSFELWDSEAKVTPDAWFTSNIWAHFALGLDNVTQSTDAQGGQFAARLENHISGLDTVIGYITNTAGDLQTFQGGVPYSRQPDTLRGWFKCDISPNDSGAVLVVFKAGGNVISMDALFITGTSSNYNYLELPLSLGSMPDTMILAVFASLPDGQNCSDGSWLQVDNLSFNIQGPIANGDFENWTSVTRREPTGWSSADIFGGPDEVATRSTDAITGNYAVQIETQVILAGADTMSFISSGTFSNAGLSHGLPYTLTTDTLCGFYKYAGQGLDSALIGAVFYQAGNVSDVAIRYLDSKSTYTYFEIPFQLQSAADSVRIDIYASNPNGQQILGSRLLIDSLRFKSDPLVDLSRPRPTVVWQVFPNPMQGQAWVELALENAGDYQLEVYNLAGQKLQSIELGLESGAHRMPLDLQQLPAGHYWLRLQGPDFVGSLPFICQ